MNDIIREITAPASQRHDISISFFKNTLTCDSDFCLTHCCLKNTVTIQGISIYPPEKLPLEKLSTKKLSTQRLSIALIAGSTFTQIFWRGKEIIAAFRMTLYEIDKILKKYETSRMNKVETENDKIRELVPEDYYEFLSLFKKAVAEVLPLYYSYNYKIPLREGFNLSPLFRSSLFLVQLRALSSPLMDC